jgi:hypothetical protein
MTEMSERQRRAFEQWEAEQAALKRTSSPTRPGRAAPGWYPRPDMSGTQGYWDGAKWTGEVVPMAPSTGATTQAVSSRVETIGWITAILMPIVGFIIGIVMLGKGQGRGVGMIVLALVAFYVFYQSILNSSGSGY